MKAYKILYCISFFLILAIPLVGMLWYEEPEATENKVLAEEPQFVEDGKVNMHFLADLDTYFSDHFAYRQEFVTANSVIMAQVFKQSAEDLAIVGKDDWLYLKVTLDDYQGTNQMSDRGIQNVVTVIRLMQEYVESQGKTFVFATAPNKNTLYPENMPYYYTKTKDPTNNERVTALLYENNLSFVDLQKMFSEDDRVLYHVGDSHWDNRGAAMVQHALLEKAGVEHTDYTQLAVKTREDFEGDIDKILFPQNRHSEVEYDYEELFTFEYVDTTDVTAPVIETSQSEGNGLRLLCFRDSFGNSLLPFLAQDFDYAKYCKAIPYRIDLTYKENYDICIVELVERNLNHLIKFAPVMPAPLRVFSEETVEICSEHTTFMCTEFEDYYKYSGIIDGAYVDSTSPIYLRFSGDAGCYVIEATPSDESSISGVPSDYGYVAYIGKTAFPAGTYQVEIITEAESEYYSQPIEMNIMIE